MRISDWSSDVCSSDLWAIGGDPQRVEQIVAHLVQNAIDASPADQPVEISLCAPGREAQIVIADRGGGMSASFIRDQLFKPFVSTKTGGFGIGAFESREIVRAMRSEEHTSELQSLMRSSYAVFCLKKKTK